jgi:DNA-nicking Smr family endonuclease
MADRDNHDDDGEARLFRRKMRGIKPLRSGERAPPPRPKIQARAHFSREDERQALQESLHGDMDEIETSGGEHLRFCRASVGRRTMRKLARGGFSAQNEIDLHGMISAEARQALRDFIAESCWRGHSCIRVIHGKGLGSGERGPVLKTKVSHWLKQWDEVLAFTSARPVDGGTGAVYVLLKCR